MNFVMAGSPSEPGWQWTNGTAGRMEEPYRRLSPSMPGAFGADKVDRQSGHKNAGVPVWTRERRLKKKSTSSEELMLPSGGSDRRRSGDLSIFSRTLYQLSYRA
ncbi:MAG: hypothetical protein QOH40_867 [Arthrobacter pascens]|nr:hypothetical protein [Arthrobacter pascens]